MTSDANQLAETIRRNAFHLSDAAYNTLAKMYYSKKLIGVENKEIEIGDTFISVLQGAELNRVLRDINAKSTLEIGFAFGFSTIWMLDAVSMHDDGTHEAIDPFEKSHYGGVGLQQVLDTGTFSEKFVWHADYSAQKLCEFIGQERRFDAVFIDGNHRFDDVIVDFYLSDQIVQPGGIIAFDDMWMDAIKSATSFVLSNRNYELVDCKEPNMLVLKKIGDDKRQWDHYLKFDTFPRERKEKPGFISRFRARA